MIYIGIDPGASGGIAAVSAEGKFVAAFRIPESERDVLDALGGLNTTGTDAESRAVLERVWSSPGWGHAGAFTFGCSVGSLRMALTAARVPFDEVLPRAWQKAMGVTFEKNTPPVERKNITKRRAQQIFPAEKITHAIADALLMAEFCRRLHRGYGRQRAAVRV